MDLVIFLPVLFSSLGIFFVVLFLVIARFKHVEQPGAALPRPAAAHPAVHTPPVGVAVGRWNGEILGDGAVSTLGGTVGSTFGVFEVRGAMMTFTPEGAEEPDWITPCHALVVAKRGILSLNGADISISWPTGPGVWRTASCNVSRERINRVMGNDFKDLRERGYADEFLACLAANGARVSG